MRMPDGWKLVPIKEICSCIIDCVNKTAPIVDYETPYKMIRTTNVRNGRVDTKNVRCVTEETYNKWTRRGSPKSGDLIFTREAPVGEVGIIEDAEGVFLGQRTVMYRAHPQKSNNLFILYSLQSRFCKKQIEDFSNGGTVSHVRVPDCSEIILKTPRLPEQQKIAQILSTWDKAIEKLEALIDAKQKRKKALMQRLLTGKMRFTEHVTSLEVQKTKYGSVPAEWEYLHIGDVAKQISLKNNRTLDLPVLSCTKHYGLVDSLAYFGKRIYSEDTSTYKIVPKNAFAYATNHIEEGSIGYQSLYEEALISPMYTVFQTNNNINDEFLYSLLKTELYRHIFEANTSASVDRRGSLRWNEFAQLKIPVPSLPEQQKIADIFTAADKEITTHQNQFAALKKQKQGLMQQLLTGKKRVNVNQAAA